MVALAGALFVAFAVPPSVGGDVTTSVAVANAPPAIVGTSVSVAPTVAVVRFSTTDGNGHRDVSEARVVWKRTLGGDAEALAVRTSGAGIRAEWEATVPRVPLAGPSEAKIMVKDRAGAVTHAVVGFRDPTTGVAAGPSPPTLALRAFGGALAAVADLVFRALHPYR
ncbi:MAG: hypothetical protein ACT4PT_12435 [Methanobacteriota archaeon]